MYAALFTSLLPCFVTNDVYVLVVRTRRVGLEGFVRSGIVSPFPPMIGGKGETVSRCGWYGASTQHVK